MMCVCVRARASSIYLFIYIKIYVKIAQIEKGGTEKNYQPCAKELLVYLSF